MAGKNYLWQSFSDGKQGFVMRFLTVLPVLLALAGCNHPGVIDHSAVPSARQAFLLAYEQCDADKSLDTYVKQGECLLLADLNFAKAVKLQKPELYATYVQRVRLATAEMDAKRAPEAEVVERITRIRKDYMASITDAVGIDAADRQERAANAAAFGAALGNLRSSLPQPAPVYAPPPPLSVRCRTVNLGNGISRTNCD